MAWYSVRLAGPLIVMLGIAACQSVSTERMSVDQQRRLQGRYPIASFNGFEPYADGRRTINAYLDVARSGLLGATLGCGEWTAPYTLMMDRSLVLTGEFVKPNYGVAGCDDEVEQRERELARFLAHSPKFGRWGDGGMLRLTAGKDQLIFAPVDELLKDN